MGKIDQVTTHKYRKITEKTKVQTDATARFGGGTRAESNLSIYVNWV